MNKFKFLLLGSTYLYREAENEQGNDGGKEKSPAELEREKIKVTTSKATEEVETEEKTDDDKKNEKEEEQDSVDEDDKGEEEETEDDKEEDKVEAKDDKDKEIEALKRQLARAQKRIGKTSAERDANKKQVAALEKQLETKIAEGEVPLTEEEVNKRAEQLADQKVTKLEFDNMQDKLVRAAKKVDKEFEQKVNEMAAEVAPIPGFMIGVLNNLENENGGAVLSYLANNHDTYEDIINTNDPTKMITRLIRISDKLAADSKPKSKPISKVPDPPSNDIKGSSSSPNILPANPTKNMDQFVRIRAQQAEAHRKRKLGLA